MTGIGAFWHVGLSVADISRSIGFYCDGLGLEVRSRGISSAAAPEVWNADAGTTGEVVFLGIPGGPDIVELLQIAGMPQRDASSEPWQLASAHMCLETDDLAVLFERMTGLGYSARSTRPVPLPTGVLAGGMAVYFIDPDGFHVEVVQRPVPASD
jgi:lactoylglutathione lyase